MKKLKVEFTVEVIDAREHTSLPRHRFEKWIRNFDEDFDEKDIWNLVRDAKHTKVMILNITDIRIIHTFEVKKERKPVGFTE